MKYLDIKVTVLTLPEKYYHHKKLKCIKLLTTTTNIMFTFKLHTEFTELICLISYDRYPDHKSIVLHFVFAFHISYPSSKQEISSQNPHLQWNYRWQKITRTVQLIILLHYLFHMKVPF